MKDVKHEVKHVVELTVPFVDSTEDREGAIALFAATLGALIEHQFTGTPVIGDEFKASISSPQDDFIPALNSSKNRRRRIVQTFMQVMKERAQASLRLNKHLSCDMQPDVSRYAALEIATALEQLRNGQRIDELCYFGKIAGVCTAMMERLNLSVWEDCQDQEPLRTASAADNTAPIPMQLICPRCYTEHVDEGEWATKPHHTHACQECGLVWRPAVVPTVGVKFLPGMLNRAD